MSRFPKGTSSLERRSLIRTAVSSLPIVMNVASIRYLLGSLVDEAFGEELATTTPTFHLEINLRDQWDFGHVMVAPGLAKAADAIRGPTGNQLAVFYTPDQLRKAPNNVFLTPVSLELEPHLDSIAMIELCELSMGTIHGHEAANACRSPGRSYQSGAGRLAMWERDPRSKIGGNENHFSSTPTIACLHNHAQHLLTPDLPNGYAFKGLGRSDHTVYHFPHQLLRGDLDRFQTKEALMRAFRVDMAPILPSPSHSALVSRLLKRFDRSTMTRAGFNLEEWQRHESMLNALPSALHRVRENSGEALEFSPEEREFWTSGIPSQRSANPKLNIGDQVGYACKLFAAGVIRTACVEFDYLDVHDQRTHDQMDVMALQTVRPLVRAIKYLKDAGLYDRTLITCYTLDGGRSPAAASTGDSGKNAVIFAGGMIRGGYYGDITIAGPSGNGHRYRYHPPEGAEGLPHAIGTLGRDLRVSGADIWRTAAAALDVPLDLRNYPDTLAGQSLQYVMR